MDFFERQRQLKRLSRRLIALFALAVAGIVILVDVTAVVTFWWAVELDVVTISQDAAGEGRTRMTAAVALLATAVTVGITGLATAIRMTDLARGGGGRVAREQGGVYVPEDTTHPVLRRLHNVVEEVAIASGVPVPQIYVLKDEPGINAFAAGLSPADAAVTVTRGALERLNRDELQAVIAHEFSHVVNGDMRLNVHLIGMLAGIMSLGRIGGALARNRSSGGGPIVLFGLVVLLAGYVGVVVGRLIKATVGRHREYLADAAAVQFTASPPASSAR
jgi:Zn-dependent protease with chaperone function